MKNLIIRDSFGDVTGLRHNSISDKSGEDFYHEYLNAAFKECYERNEVLTVDLDGNKGYSPSFIDEAFGNLVFDYKVENVEKLLKIKSDDFKFWETSVKTATYPLWELRRKRNDEPKKTILHNPWWKINNNGVLEQKIWIFPTENVHI